MFDNSIFASFIPQILMVLGFISCILAPKLSSKQATNSEIKSVDKIISFQTENKKDINTANFSHYQKNDFKNRQIEVKEYLTPTLLIAKIFYPDISVNRIKTDFASALFSRPPPFSVFKF